MPLDLCGLTREERVMVQASISNERDFDRVADALIIQHPRNHLRESQRRAKGEGKDGFKRFDNPNARWFRGKGKGKHTGSGKPERVPITRTSLPLKIAIITMMKTLKNPQTLVKPTMTQLTVEVMTEKKLWAMMMTRKMTLFSVCCSG